MLSSELAELAGVTVRTLRHYHHIGLLPEPSRSESGYRRYDVVHLVRLLRTTRMAALGVPLADIPTVLDGPAAAEEMLGELDRQAVLDIERLSARRRSIAALRRTGGPPDLPPELSAWYSALLSAVPAEVRRREREWLTLFGHLLGEDGPARLAALLDEADPAKTGIASILLRFFALTADSARDEVTSLIGDWTKLIEPLRDRLGDLRGLDSQASVLATQLSENTLTPVQGHVLHQVGKELCHLGMSEPLEHIGGA